MDSNPLENPDEKKMIEHGIIIKIPDEVLQDKITIKPEPMVVEPEMRVPQADFIFKRLVVNYSFSNVGVNEQRKHTLRVYVSHLDYLLYNVRKLAIWKGGNWGPIYADLKSLDSPNPAWHGYFEVELGFGDPPVALGE